MESNFLGLHRSERYVPIAVLSTCPSLIDVEYLKTEYSVNAVNWLLKSLAEDNDEVVVLRVIEPGSSAHNAWKSSMEEARDEAEDVLEDLMQRNADEKSVRNPSNPARREQRKAEQVVNAYRCLSSSNSL